MSQYHFIPAPSAPTGTAQEIAERLREGERVEYEEIEAMREDDFRDIVRPIAHDDGDGWVLSEEE